MCIVEVVYHLLSKSPITTITTNSTVQQRQNSCRSGKFFTFYILLTNNELFWAWPQILRSSYILMPCKIFFHQHGQMLIIKYEMAFKLLSNWVLRCYINYKIPKIWGLSILLDMTVNLFFTFACCVLTQRSEHLCKNFMDSDESLYCFNVANIRS